MNIFNSTTFSNKYLTLNTTLFNEKAIILIEHDRATIKLNGNRPDTELLFKESFNISELFISGVDLNQDNTVCEVTLNNNNNNNPEYKKFLRATLKDNNIFLDFIVTEDVGDGFSDIILNSTFY